MWCNLHREFPSDDDIMDLSLAVNKVTSELNLLKKTVEQELLKVDKSSSKNDKLDDMDKSMKSLMESVNSNQTNYFRLTKSRQSMKICMLKNY
jgi:hypothetical protein